VGRAGRGLVRLSLIPALCLAAAIAVADDGPLPDVVSVLSRTTIVVHDPDGIRIHVVERREPAP
jgi:hypothetical protein